MNALPIICDGKLEVQILNPLYGNSIVHLDPESLTLLQNNPLIQEVQGHIINKLRTTEQDIKYYEWVFHIDSFTGC